MCFTILCDKLQYCPFHHSQQRLDSLVMPHLIDDSSEFDGNTQTNQQTNQTRGYFWNWMEFHSFKVVSVIQFCVEKGSVPRRLILTCFVPLGSEIPVTRIVGDNATERALDAILFIII